MPYSNYIPKHRQSSDYSFDPPENYFNTFPDRVHQSIAKGKRQHRQQRIFTYSSMALAASIIIIFSLIYNPFHKPLTSPAENTEMAMDLFGIDGEYELSEDEIFDVLASDNSLSSDHKYSHHDIVKMILDEWDEWDEEDIMAFI